MLYRGQDCLKNVNDFRNFKSDAGGNLLHFVVQHSHDSDLDEESALCLQEVLKYFEDRINEVDSHGMFLFSVVFAFVYYVV